MSESKAIRVLRDDVEALIEQLTESKAECARLAEKAATAVQRAEDAGACVLALETTVAQLERQRDAARTALKRYGRHECNARWSTDPCTCGLSAALENS